MTGRALALALDRERSGRAAARSTPAGAVPVAVLVNQPRVDGTGQGEHEAIIPLLDAINKTLIDLLTTSEFTAAPQRYASGITLDQEQDETRKRKRPMSAAGGSDQSDQSDSVSEEDDFGSFDLFSPAIQVHRRFCLWYFHID